MDKNNHFSIFVSKLKIIHMIFIYIIRELSKLCMFIALWGFPILLAKTFNSPAYLWFFALSFIATMSMFAHYETITRIENLIDEDIDDDK